MESVSGMFRTGWKTLRHTPKFPLRSFAAAVCLLFGTNIAVAFASDMLPAGVEQPAPGVYPSEDDPGCCWLRPAARFTILQAPATDTISIDFVIPPFATEKNPTALTVAVGGASYRVCCFGVGEHQASIHLRRSSRARQLTMLIDSSTRFVPAERGLNQDRRVLTVLLKRVATIDSATGEMYLGAAPVSSNLLLPRWRIRLDGAVLAIAAGLMLFLLLRRAKFAWIAIVLAAPFLFPVPIHGTTLSLEKVVIVLVALVMLVQPRFRAALLTAPGRWILVALVLFVADMALSGAGAVFRGAAIRETLKFAEYALAFAVVYGAYAMDPDESALRVTLVWVMCIVCVLALAQPFVQPLQRMLFQGHVVPRIAGPLEGPNQLGAFLGIVLVAVTAISRRLWAIGFALALGSVVLLLTVSRGSIAAFVFGIAIVLALRAWPHRRTAVLCGAAALCVAALALTALTAATFPNAALDRIFGSADVYNGGLGSRAGLWHAAVMLWRTHPLIGVGPGNYELLVGRILPGVRTHPNGYFFQVLAEQGILGFVLLLSLIVVPAVAFVREGNGPFAIAGLAVLATLTFHQLLDGLFPYPKVAIEYWALIAIAAAAATTRSGATSDA